MNNDSEAKFITELCDRQAEPLKKFCHAKQLSEEQTADCLAEVFLAARKRGAKLAAHPKPEAWLVETCARTIRRLLRAESSCQTRTVSLDALQEGGKEPGGVSMEGKPYSEPMRGYTEAFARMDMPESEIRRIKEEALAALTESERALYTLAYERRIPPTEAAEQLGISRSAFLMRRRRLELKLRKHLDKYFYD